MLCVEVTYSLSLDISSFDNIDLVRRGYYRLQFNVKPPAQGAVKLQCSTPKNKQAGKDGWCKVMNDGCTAVSAPVLVEYTKQCCSVDSHFVGVVTMILPAKQVCSGKYNWPLLEASLDLCFSPLRKDESSMVIPVIASYDKIDSRPLVLSLCEANHQLHAARYILYRCKNHSGAKLQLHMALTAAKPVLVEKSKEKPQLWLWLSSSTDEVPANGCVSDVEQVPIAVLRQLCALLLESQVGLVDKCQELVSASTLPAERLNVALRVEELLRGCRREVPFTQALDYLMTASAVALSMWDVFLLVLGQEKGVEEHLLYDYHQEQVNRFQNVHFLVKLPMSELLSTSSGNSRLTFTAACDLVAALNRTGYTTAVFGRPSPVYCPETDGTDGNAPVIMEQRFIRQSATSRMHQQANHPRAMAANPALNTQKAYMISPLKPHTTSRASVAASSDSVVPPTPAADGVRYAPPAQASHRSPPPSTKHRIGPDDCGDGGGGAGGGASSASSNLIGSASGGSDEADGLFRRRGSKRRRLATAGCLRQSIGHAQERLRPQLPKNWHFLSDFSRLSVPPPYFLKEHPPAPQEVHLVVCVHGLEGRSEDLASLRNFIELALPEQPLVFLMAQCLEERTLTSFRSMGECLAAEILSYIKETDITCNQISFIGHSLGNIAIRVALSNPAIQEYCNVFHTYLSLAGPHLGVVYAGSLVGTGMWLLQKYTKSVSLLELQMRDNPDPRKTLLYELSLKPSLAMFKHVLLVGSHQDQYVPFHSARVEVSPISSNDEMGSAQQEMVHNLLFPLHASTCQAELRIYNVVHQFQTTDVDVLVGRAGHIALLDSEVCLEMLVQTCLYRFFHSEA